MLFFQFSSFSLHSAHNTVWYKKQIPVHTLVHAVCCWIQNGEEKKPTRNNKRTKQKQNFKQKRQTKYKHIIRIRWIYLTMTIVLQLTSHVDMSKHIWVEYVDTFSTVVLLLVMMLLLINNIDIHKMYTC